MLNNNDMNNVMFNLPPTSKCSLTELELLNKFYNCHNDRSSESNFYQCKDINGIEDYTHTNATDEYDVLCVNDR